MVRVIIRTYPLMYCMSSLNIEIVKIRPKDGVNVILGQSHFIKTVEDLFNALSESVPGIKFGVAFCESSGKRLIRHAGTDEGLEKDAVELCKRIGCGHCFVILLGNAFPINVIPRIKEISEVVTLYCATANPIEVVIGVTGQGRCILGVVDGYPPLGVEGGEDKKERKEFLVKIKYRED